MASKVSLFIWAFSGWTIAVLVLVLQVVPFGFSRALSPFDEIAHIDYVVSLSQGTIPSWDSRYSQSTLLLADCVGSGFGPSGVCSEKFRDPTVYVPNGYSYQAQQPPLGYLPYVGVDQVWTAAMVPESPQDRLTILRWTSFLLTVIGVGLTALLAALVSRSQFAVFAVPSFVVSVPLVANAGHYVTNDAVGLIAGVIGVAPALWVLREGKRPAPILAGVVFAISGILIAMLKPTALVAPLAVLLWAAFSSKRLVTSGRPALLIRSLLVAQIGAGLVSVVAFSFWQSWRSTTSAVDVLNELLSFSRTSTSPWVASANGVADAFTFAFMSWDPETSLRLTVPALLLALIWVGVLLISVVPGPESMKIWNRLPHAIVAAVVISALIWTWGMYLQQGFVLELPTRYLLPLIPLLAILSLKTFIRMQRVAILFPFGVAGLTLLVVSPIVPLWIESFSH